MSAFDASPVAGQVRGSNGASALRGWARRGLAALLIGGLLGGYAAAAPPRILGGDEPEDIADAPTAPSPPAGEAPPIANGADDGPLITDVATLLQQPPPAAGRAGSGASGSGAATMPGGTSGAATPRAPSSPSIPRSISSGLNVGSTASALGGARGPQSTAPYMIGDLYNVGNGGLTIVAPGNSFNQTFTSPFSVPIQLPSYQAPFPPGSTASFNSPGQPPFTSQIFMVDANSANNQFVAGHPISLTPPPQYTQQVQSYLNSQYPSGHVLPNGQISNGNGTAQFLNGNATFDPSNSSNGPQNGRDVAPGDHFFLSNTYQFSQPTLLTVHGINPANSGGTLLGINKIAENTSPLPRDRIFFNYSLFTGTQLAPGGFNINRFTPGFERTFFNRLFSMELRLPFAATVNPDFTTGGPNGITSSGHVIFGNISAVLKALIYQTDTFAFSGGLQTTVPTAPSLTVSTPDGTRLVAVDNQAVHLMPFIGALYTPNDRFFAQSFIQVDIDANGNPVSINPTGTGLTNIGRIHAQNLLFLDFNAGYWLYRSQRSRLTGFAPTIEYHYNQSVDHSQFLASNGFVIGANASQVSFQGVTVGSYFEFEQLTTMALAYTAPIGNGVDQAFRGELRAFITRRFGTPTRANRIGFQ